MLESILLWFYFSGLRFLSLFFSLSHTCIFAHRIDILIGVCIVITFMCHIYYRHVQLRGLRMIFTFIAHLRRSVNIDKWIKKNNNTNTDFNDGFSHRTNKSITLLMWIISSQRAKWMLISVHSLSLSRKKLWVFLICHSIEMLIEILFKKEKLKRINLRIKTHYEGVTFHIKHFTKTDCSTGILMMIQQKTKSSSVWLIFVIVTVKDSFHSNKRIQLNWFHSMSTLNPMT